MGFPVIRDLPAIAEDARDECSIPGSGRAPRVGNGNPLQDSCSMDREAWRCRVLGVEKSWTLLSMRAHNYIHGVFFFYFPANIMSIYYSYNRKVWGK